MTLTDWEHNGWLKKHTTSLQEINDLYGIIRRDLQDAQNKTLSADWRFGIAYNAALKLCTVILYAEGYKPENTQAHYRTIMALSQIMGPKKQSDADFLNVCRAKGNIVEYSYSGGATDSEAEELIQFTGKLSVAVRDWLQENHPALVPTGLPG